MIWTNHKYQRENSATSSYRFLYANAKGEGKFRRPLEESWGREGRFGFRKVSVAKQGFSVEEKGRMAAT